MKIQIASDLHFETLRGYCTPEEVLPLDKITGDVLLLIGDISNNPMDLNYLREVEIPILYIPGNHEYYRHHFPAQLYKLKQFFELTNIHVLDNEIKLINGGKFVCATMWTDMNHSFDSRLCKEVVNDFHVIGGMSIGNWIRAYDKSRDYIRECLTTKIEGEEKVVVATHMAPSFKSEVRHKGSAISGAFCAHMDDIIEKYQPILWAHGHTHDIVDYKIGETRVVSNPRGYNGELHGWSARQKYIVEI